MSAWSEAAWVIRELTKKLEIEKKVKEMVDKVPIIIISSKNENGNFPNVSDDLNIPKESVWFITEGKNNENNTEEENSENNTEGE